MNFFPQGKSYLLQTFGLLILTVLFAANVQRARSIGMADHPPIWVVDAIPAALSDLAFANHDGYTSFKAVSEVYYGSLSDENPTIIRNSEMVDRAIDKVLKLDPRTVSRETVLLGGDDKGIVDFVKVAFRLFGYSTEKLIYLYFILLFASVLMFVLSFRETLLPQAIAGAFFVSHYLILPAVYYHMQLQSVLALRFLPVLPMIACLHCLFFIQRPSLTWPALAALTAQASLLVLGVHLRSVTSWELTLVGLMGIAVAGWSLLHRSRNDPNVPKHGLLLTLAHSSQSLLPGALLLLGMLALTGYRQVAYDARYTKGDQILTRPMWHNLVSGFAFNPELARHYDLKIDDFSVIRATGNFLKEHDRAAEWEAIGGNTPDFRIRWTLYDSAAKEFLFSILFDQPRAALATMLYYKPAALGRDLAWLYGFRQEVPDVDLFVSPQLGDAMAIHLRELTRGVDEHRQRFILWHRLALLVIVAFALALLIDQTRPPLGDWLALGMLALGSLIPTIAGYPALHTIGEPALMCATVIYTGTIFGLSRLLAFVSHRRN